MKILTNILMQEEEDDWLDGDYNDDYEEDDYKEFGDFEEDE